MTALAAPATPAPRGWSLDADLRAISAGVGTDWGALDGARIFVTGGSGFIGSWLLQALGSEAARSGRRFDIDVLSRDPDAFRRNRPEVANAPGIRLLRGDVLDFPFPDGPCDLIVHAAADASAALNRDDPLRMFDTIVGGTRRVLEFAAGRRVRRMLFLSSGAVYGRQPADLPHVPETWSGAPDCAAATSAYAEGKRAAETLCAVFAQRSGLEVVTARIFATLGPRAPLDSHFAAGNFIRQAMRSETIVVRGDGSPTRSYLYIADLATALLRLLARGRAGEAYNLGSSRPVSIGELAQTVGRILGAPHRIEGAPDRGWNPGRYIPSTAKFDAEFGTGETIDLEDAIRRTALWNGWPPGRLA